MRNVMKGILLPLSKKEMAKLSFEVKETLVISMLPEPRAQRSFGAIDLWNARRQQRTMRSMRRYQ